MYSYYHFKCQKHDRKHKQKSISPRNESETPGQVSDTIMYQAKVNLEHHCFDIHMLDPEGRVGYPLH